MHYEVREEEENSKLGMKINNLQAKTPTFNTEVLGTITDHWGTISNGASCIFK